MALKVKDIAEIMEELAPVSLAESWDNCGLIIGDPTYHVDRLLVALDLDMTVLEEAIREGVQMIITHHPILFSKTNRITAQTPEGIKIMRLIQHNIALYSAHTNLDQTKGGLEDVLAKRLGFKKHGILDPQTVTPEGDARGYGRIANLHEVISLREFADHVRRALNIESLTMVGDPNALIRIAASACGSGSHQIDAAKKAGADVLVTGDIKYHSAQYAQDLSICLIDAGHYGTEKFAVELIAGFIRSRFPELKVIEDNVFENPIKILE